MVFVVVFLSLLGRAVVPTFVIPGQYKNGRYALYLQCLSSSFSSSLARGPFSQLHIFLPPPSSTTLHIPVPDTASSYSTSSAWRKPGHIIQAKWIDRPLARPGTTTQATGRLAVLDWGWPTQTSKYQTSCHGIRACAPYVRYWTSIGSYWELPRHGSASKCLHHTAHEAIMQ